MKLKASEIAFVVICLICVAVGIAISVKVRVAGSDGVIDLSIPEYADVTYPVDILNSATTGDFMEISGIGQVKASDIIAFRDAIGGFKRVEQLKEVNGISDATYAKIIEHFYVDTADEAVTTVTEEQVSESPANVETMPVTKAENTTAAKAAKVQDKTAAPTTTVSEPEKVMREVDINAASAEELADALLIDIELAESIISLREQIHYFSSVTELYLADGMSGEIYRMIEEYIIIGE